MSLITLSKLSSHHHTTAKTVKYVPEWCPGAGFQKIARLARVTVQRARVVPFNDVKARMVCDFQRHNIICSIMVQKAAGTAKPCFVANSLNDLGTSGDWDDFNEDVDAIKRVAGGMFGGE